MKREKNYKTARLIEALEYIDVRFIEEAAEKIKPRPTGQAFYGKPSRSKALRQFLALAACVLLLSASIPAITYLANHLPDIVAFFIGDETTDTDPELTHPETPPTETSRAPETTVNTDPETTAPLYDGTTAEPEPEHNGSYGLEYKMNEDGKSAMLFHRGICTDENVIVASVWNGVPVTRISEAALAEYVKYKTVTIPESVTVIDMRAFKNCTGLESVVLHDGISYIGADAFENCVALTEITLPKSLEWIQTGLFANCINLQKVIIGNEVERIVYGAFYDCSALRELHYLGTKAEWNKIQKDETWNTKSAITVVHCADGDVDLIEYDGSRGLEYRIDGDHAVLVGIGTCTDKDLAVASTYNGYPVTVIGERALYYKNINSIKISDTVEVIEKEALGAGKYVSVYISSSVRQLEGAFSTCDRLEEIIVDAKNPKYKSVNNCLINKETKTLVLGCKNSIIPADGSVTVIGTRAFETARFTEIAIPNGIIEIGEGAFAWCMMLESIVIPDSVKIIGDEAFMDCESAKTLKIGKGVESIGHGAFYYCFNITEVELPKDLKTLGGNAFGHCGGLKSIVIPDGVKLLDGGSSLFSSCDSLESIILPEGIEEIGGWFFGGCRNLKSITIPSSVKAIGENAFYGCYLLKEIIIPEGVTEIGEGAFEQCKGITKIVIPDSVKTIGKSAFEGCTELVSVVLPSSINEISTSLFSECSKLKEVNIPAGVTAISSYAFRKCISIEKLILPDSVKTIGEYTFNECSALRAIYLGDGLESIGIWAFESCTSLKEIALPDSLKEIGHHAFVSSGLESVTIPKGITTINEGVFTSCLSLKDVSLPQGLTKLDYRVFTGCTSLETLVIPDTVTTLGGEIFENCTSLKSLTIPASVKTIQGSELFMNCTSLTSMTIPNGIKMEFAYYSMFEGCTSLESVTLPSDLSRVSGEIFKNCVALTEINYKGTVAQWNVLIKEDNWNSGCAATLVHCSDGDVSLIESDGSRGLAIRIIGDHAEVTGIGTCTNTDIVIPSYYSGYPVTQINIWAFKDNTRITSVKISDTVTMIEGNAFAGCTSLRSIYISASVSNVTALSFDGCTNITSITVDPNNPYYEGTNCIIQKSNKWLLLGCRTTVIPSDGSVEYIGGCSFNGISGLYSITVPEGVIDIDTSAFNNCPDLRELHLPSTLRYASGGESNIISGCNNIEVITIPKNSEYFYVDGNCLIEKQTGNLILGCKTSVIPTDGSVKAIGRFAFSGITDLRELVIPEGIIRIEHGAFASCKNLKNISFPKSLIEFGWWAFENCISLEKITVPENVLVIGIGTFRACTKLTEVALPKKLEVLEWDSFAQCTALQEISFLGTRAEWDSIKNDGSWYVGSAITVIHCSDGDVFAEPMSYDEATELARQYWSPIESGYFVRYASYEMYLLVRPDEVIVDRIYIDRYTGEISQPKLTYPDIPDPLLKVLLNETTYIRQFDSGSEGYFKDTILDYPTAETGSFGYAVCDLDGDGKEELILSSLQYEIVLREFEGKVYGYLFDFRSLLDLKTDGSFNFTSNAGMTYGTARLSFDGTKYVFTELTRREHVDNGSISYFVDDKKVTKEEFDAREALLSQEEAPYEHLAIYPLRAWFPGG